MLPSPAGGAPVPMLRTDALTKRYGDVTALDGLSVDVPGGSVGLVGANGAGKTTLFRLLLGLTRPTSGTVEVVGHRVDLDPVGARSRLGFMPEHDCLPLDQSAADVVATFGELAGLPARAARQRASDVLDLVGLDDARFRPVGGFSTGMRQRTKLAQALVADPGLVLLDEPTAGLDPQGREEMLALVARLAGFGVSVLLATHLLDDVQEVCEHVVMLDGGRLVVAGRTAGLLERSGTVRVVLRDGAGALASRLRSTGLEVVVVDETTLDATLRSADDLDLVRDEVADAGLALHALSPRHASLDDVYLDRHALLTADRERAVATGAGVGT